MALPEWFVQTLSPTLGSFSRQKRKTRDQVAHAIATKDEWSGRDIQSVFRGLADSPKLPLHEKTVDRLAQDAQMLLMAGTLTMASTLEHMIYWISDNPNVLRKLKQELKSVMPSINDSDKVTLATLESLPYMTAVIKESVRLIYGNSCPHFRVCPDQPLYLEDKARGKTWTIPPVGVLSLYNTSAHDVEMNGDFFIAAYNKAQGVEFKIASI
ncbi:putative Trichodiene oxygenase [Glarea lozoyensis 74030]|uniref:Putative Trichodiene oxygenase n=1 Tax=Glarea lozoyensis (strain ATCC 74030 / MF5533) TaxID=1104152 RepID=H0EWE2_GLAL7|nr:putative Trichodiene oxygenase [Glarea lozoyensis 74030]